MQGITKGKPVQLGLPVDIKPRRPINILTTGKTLELSDRCEFIATTLTKSEQQKHKDKESHWDDGYYKFEEGSLAIEAEIFCDGPVDITVEYCGRRVLVYDSDGCEDPGSVIVYEPGAWEEQINKLYERVEHLREVS